VLFTNQISKCLGLERGKVLTQFGEIFTKTNLSKLRGEGGGLARGQTVTTLK
jgi:hypothetical protein